MRWLLLLLLCPVAAASHGGGHLHVTEYEPENPGEAAAIRLDSDGDDVRVRTWAGPSSELPGVLAGWDAPAVAAGVGLLAWFARVPLMLLFSRLHNREVLRHPRRQRLLELVQASPGIHLQELTEQAGMARGSVAYHLGVLVRAGRVTCIRGRGYTCYAPKETASQVRDAAPVLRAPVAQATWSLIQQSPGVSVSDLARMAGATRGNVGHHVRRMEAAGLVHGVRRGRRVCWYPQAPP